MAHAGRTRLSPVTFSFYWLVVLWSPLGDTVVDPHVAASPLADPIRCPAARTAKGDNHARGSHVWSPAWQGRTRPHVLVRERGRNIPAGSPRGITPLGHALIRSGIGPGDNVTIGSRLYTTVHYLSALST